MKSAAESVPPLISYSVIDYKGLRAKMAMYAKKLMARSQITTIMATEPLFSVVPDFFVPILILSATQVEVRTYRYALKI